ncbi:MAG: hypothetical protein HDT34_01900 [Clostridiales bacterium]|nr:hypothetical protein [Clostridiales bacterium]
MTSTNSSSNFFKTLKNNFRRHAALFTTFQIIAFLFSVLIILFQLDYTPEAIEDVTESFSYECINVFAAFCMIELFIFVASMFKGIYSKRASDYYFSLPVKRGAWFNANFVFGMISAAVSYAVFYFCSVFALKFNVIKAFKNFELDAGKFLKYILMSFAAMLVLYTIYVMCAVVSGRMWQYILLSFISTVVLFIGAVGFISYLNTIYGAWINLYEAYTVSSLKLVFSDLTEASVPAFLIAAFAQFAVVYLAGYFAFKTRKAEVAENKLSGKVLPAVLTIICFLSEVFICLGVSEVTLYGRILAAVIITVVTAVILSAIFFRKAFSKPVLISLFSAVVLSAVAVFCVQIVPEKTYVNYVPESSEVETVTLSDCGNIGSPSITDFLYGIDYLDTGAGYTKQTYTFSTDAGKDKFNQLHKIILSEETRKKVYSEEPYLEELYYDSGFRTLEFEYKLKNGKTMKRTYTVSSEQIYKEYVSLLQTDEGLNQVEDFDIDPDEIIFAEVAYDEDIFADYVNFSIGIDDISAHIDDYKKLYQCIRMDWQKASPRRFAFSKLNAHMLSVYNEEDFADVSETEGFIEIVICAFNENMNEKQKADVEKMTTYDEIRDYEAACLEKQDKMEAIFFNHVYLISYEDENTISYLKELGYEFKK